MLKKVVSVSCFALMMMSMCASFPNFFLNNNGSDTMVYAASETSEHSEKTVLKLTIGKSTMTVNGKETAIDEQGTAPIIKDGRTLLPIRAVIEAFGGSAEWDSGEGSATIKYNGNTVVLKADSDTASLNGKETKIDVKPVVINGTTMLPIRYIAESFGLEIDWDSDTKTVSVSEDKNISDDMSHDRPSNDNQNARNGMSFSSNAPEIQAVIDANASKFTQGVYEKEDGAALAYSLYVPENYDKDKSYPLIMYIPDSTGAGKSPEEVVGQYYGADVWVTDEDQKKHPSFVFVPAFSETVVDDDFNVSNQVDSAVAMINKLTEDYNIDTNRIYTTGQSMGCMTSLYLNSKYPDMFAASMFVSGQWDISVLKCLENAKFFYITAGGDTKASGGQDEVKAMLDADGIKYTYDEWNAQLDSDKQNESVKQLTNKGLNANMIRFETGSVLTDGVGMEHMSSFNYAYKLDAVRDWLFEQTK